MARTESGRYRNRLLGFTGFAFSNAVNGTVAVSALSSIFAFHIYSDNQRLGAAIREIPTNLQSPIKWEMPWKYRMIVEHFQNRPYLQRRFLVGRFRTEGEKDAIRGRIVRKCLTAKWEAKANDADYYAKERPTARDWRVKVFGGAMSNLCVRPWWGIPRR